jgi:hypothetical protein
MGKLPSRTQEPAPFTVSGQGTYKPALQELFWKGKTMARTALLAAIILITSVPLIADTLTVTQLVNYQNNYWDANGPWFMPPNNTMDHPPYHRGAWEDWGWTHDMSALVPAGATGIASATLSIRDWDVDTFTLTEDTTLSEDDRVYAVRTSAAGSPTLIGFRTTAPSGDATTLPLSVTYLGSLALTGQYAWGTTKFTSLPSAVLGDLWADGALGIFMNIDAGFSIYHGFRVSVPYAILTVDYIVPHVNWQPNIPVYRFWSPKAGMHFFTIKESEKTKLQTQYLPNVWTYERIEFYVYAEKRSTTVSPVYRFWQPKTNEHFFTISESERDELLAYAPQERAINNDGVGPTGYPSTYTYEGIAFYAHPEGQQPVGAKPVYRFYSPKTTEHFYTIDPDEKNRIIAKYPPSVWTYQEIAWYAYPTAP